MKNLSKLMFAFLLVFASCSSDDDNNQNDLTVDITGSWELTNLEYSGENETVFQGQTITLVYSGFGKDFDAQAVFSENPNTIQTLGSYTIELSFEFMGITQTIDTPINLSDDISSGTWSVEGNQMIIVDGDTGEVQTAEIIQLTQNKMVLLMEQVTNMNGANVTVVAETTLER